MKDSFTLHEIANWQLNTEKSIVELPSIQRGFVWKPKQVEDLWDSLLRGYPIGSFLFSKTGERLYLMDGQQRSTSIFLGHFNPFNPQNETKAWSIKGELPVVWIDLKPEIKPYSSKYLIRLTTRSHPWGYQASNNDSKLNITDRRKALELFRKHPDNKGGYTSFKNSLVFPFDSSFPIPLCFLIESKNIEEVIEQLESQLPDYYSTKKGGFEDKRAFLNLLKDNLTKELSEIFDEIKKTQNLIIKSNIIDDRVLNEENDSENPTLFVRINSAGTTLIGDDLIYSIYKATFPDAKNLIENIGMNFIAPTQVLSLVSRLVTSDSESNNFVKKLNVRDFQRKIKNEDFKKELKTLIQTKKIENLFEQAINILSCKDNILFNGEMPPIIIKQFIRENQELFLFFIYWLYLNSSKIDINDKTKIRMVSKLLCFAWFDFCNIPRLWNEKIRNKNFWNESLNDLIRWDGDDGIHFPIKPELLKKYYEQDEIIKMFKENNEYKWRLLETGVGAEIIEYYNNIKTDTFNLPKANDFFWKFIGKIQRNKQFILFAQRDYINSTFADFNQMDEIEDTNVPWDWDHIYPNEWVYNMKNCSQSIRDWNGTNGNFRAISLEHNRSRSNQQSPKDISNDIERDYSFIQENDWGYWKNIDNRIRDHEIQNHFRAITTRMINIYGKFWHDLKINELIIEKQ
jgi:hypothetical protein